MNSFLNGTAPSAGGPPAADALPADAEYLRQLVEHIPQLVWSCLPDGHCDYLSRRWTEYSGVPVAAHHGAGWLSALHPDDRERTAARWASFITGRAEYDIEYRLRRHDGEYRWFKTRGFLLRDDTNTVRRVFGTSTDIDDQMRSEEKFRESRERLEAALAASGTGTFRWDITTNALDWDEQLDRLFGLPPGQTVRSLERFVERVHPDDRAGVVERCVRCKEEGADFVMEFRVVWPDGSVHWLDDRGRTFRDPAGRPAYMTGACVDVTKRKLAEARFRESDERATFVGKASGVGFWYCDLPFDVLEWDTLVKEHFHLSPDARVTIDTFYDRIHPDDREPTSRAIAESIASRNPYDTVYRTVHPETGVERWVRAIGRTFYSADGTPSRFDGVTLDVTAQRRAELAAAEAHRRLDAALIAGEVGTFEWDVPGDRLHGDRNFARIFGITLDESGGAPLAGYLAAIHPNDRERVLGLVRLTIDTGCDYEAEYRIVTGGDPRWVTARGKGVRATPGGPVVRFPGVVLDVTARRVAEEALKEADRRKDEFLATLAHELRNPLAPIRNGLQVIRLAADNPAAVAKSREMMDRQLSHMVRLIDDLLDVSRISRNKMELRRTSVFLRDAVSAAVETARPAIESAGHELTVTLPEESVHLDADLTRLAQVFSNLLTNAAKYTEQGGKIWLSASLVGSEAVLTVQDTGIGIPAEALPRIFDMFSQVDRSVERATGGLGIGLALVKGLVEMHGGTVAAASDGEGAGTTFTVRLPVLISHPGIAHVTPPDNGPPGPRRRVLVADDNRDSAESMGMLLELLGHEVRIVYDGLSAVTAAEEFRPELILMDVGMPGLSGYDATRRIRRLPLGRSVSVIALTGWGQECDRVESKQAGCNGHLVKPVSLADLSALFSDAPG
jgi:PAS domain S-box-containing protein